MRNWNAWDSFVGLKARMEPTYEAHPSNNAILSIANTWLPNTKDYAQGNTWLLARHSWKRTYRRCHDRNWQRQSGWLDFAPFWTSFSFRQWTQTRKSSTLWFADHSSKYVICQNHVLESWSTARSNAMSADENATNKQYMCPPLERWKTNDELSMSSRACHV